ncbi:MAG TPA: glucose 1-dehydrogenase [Candidatus Dormibacteraeota bacterium]|nr:glucose 1-dehydrogenase [Candidatus Dormibacteraeota bacterium]
MKAIVIHPGGKNSIEMRDVPAPEMAPDQIAVKTIRVGLCGTDAEINEGLYGQAPQGCEYLILGHENFGVVEDVGVEVKTKGFKPGDFVVSTVRRPCGQCYFCNHGENDMCTSGKYTERGIKGRHGYMAEYYVEVPEYMNNIPASLKEIGVLLEPMSIVEKGIDQSYRVQQRFTWLPKTALVVGAGPVGLLAAAVLVQRGLRTIVVGREPATDLRAQLVPQLGGEYLSVANIPIPSLPKQLGPLDLVVECTGNPGVVFEAMQTLAPTAVLCLLSVTGGDKQQAEPTAQINEDLVLGNNVVLGSVNANPRHYKIGIDDFNAIETKRPGVLAKLITNHLPWTQYKTWFTQRGEGIKTTLEIAG